MDNINPQVLLIIGGLLTLIGAAIAYKNEIKYRSDADKARIKIDSLAREIDLKTIAIKDKTGIIDTTTKRNKALSLQNRILNRRIDEKAEQNQGLIGTNIKLSEELVRETQEVKAEISGGDSYLKIFLVQENEGERIKVLAEIIGEYNVRNINLTIESRHKIVKPVYNTKIDELNAGVPHELHSLPMPQVDMMLYEIRIVAKNNKYVQYAYLHKVDNRYYSQHVYFNDMARSYCIGESFKPNDYPEYYKTLNPSYFEQLNIKYDLENKEIKERIKSMLLWNGMTNRRIIDFYGVPEKIINELRIEIKNEEE